MNYGLMFGFLFIPIIIIIAILWFEVVMFLDVLRNPRLSDNEKILWAIGMLLIHPVIAIVYYFVAHSRLNSK